MTKEKGHFACPVEGFSRAYSISMSSIIYLPNRRVRGPQTFLCDSLHDLFMLGLL